MRKNKRSFIVFCSKSFKKYFFEFSFEDDKIPSFSQKLTNSKINLDFHSSGVSYFWWLLGVGLGGQGGPEKIET